ncbi:HK97 gp10 family phage protein [Candidatus Kaiserbacteria bacterium]|nr:HK97 gp10 family phage protein [Candidatus Kaiserbacteria bacterium]
MPVATVVTIQGDEALLNTLNELIRPANMAPAMQRAGARIRTELAKYPPPPPNSTYRRTGKLGRSWTHRVNVNLITTTALIGNNTPYAPDVQGEGMQAEVHQGRWQTEKQVLDNNADYIVEEVAARLDELLK